MKICGFLPQSFSDWPGKTCVLLFTAGCNFRCGYCQNSAIIDADRLGKGIKLLKEEDVLAKIENLKWSLDGVAITGGEPTVQARLPKFCARIKELGLPVKLDTNGSNPEMVQKLIDEKLVDYIAVDLKTRLEPEAYKKFAGFGDVEKIKRTIKIIIDSGIDHEFRTTFLERKGVLTQEDVLAALQEIAGAKRYVVQQFLPRDCLDKEFLKYKTPSHDELMELAAKSAKVLGPKTEIRIRDDHGEQIYQKAK
ncbi:MAG: anaerobic ribonucleoside-triphosphate reductase activating protein [Candidatus Micrarchaeota archaeon]